MSKGWKTFLAVIVVITIFVIAYYAFQQYADKSVEDPTLKGGFYGGRYGYRFPYRDFPWYRRHGYYGRHSSLPFYLAGPLGRYRNYYGRPSGYGYGYH